jgi:hypothetical protein
MSEDSFSLASCFDLCSKLTYAALPRHKYSADFPVLQNVKRSPS